IGSRENGACFTLCEFQQLPVTDEIGYLETGHSGLTSAKEFSRTAKFEIEFGNLKAVVGSDHGIEATFAVLGDFAAGHEHTIGPRGSAADPPAQLMQLG